MGNLAAGMSWARRLFCPRRGRLPEFGRRARSAVRAKGAGRRSLPVRWASCPRSAQKRPARIRVAATAVVALALAAFAHL
jgi:hypothetical protein